jgi:ArsR family transcriptional regulator
MHDTIIFKYINIAISKYMEKQKIYEVHANICKVFTNPRRLEIIDLLRENERTVNELVKLMNLPQSSVSQHLAVMREKGILEAKRHGSSVTYRISDERILKACDLMREVLLDHIGKLERIVNEVKR